MSVGSCRATYLGVRIMTQLKHKLSATMLFGIYCALGGWGASGAPSLSVSLYAPEQKTSPLRITKFEYNVDSVQVVLVNVSDKPVVSVAVIGLMSLPPECTESRQSGVTGTIGGVIHPLLIPPGRDGITSRKNSPFNPANLVMSAKHFAAGGSLQVQVGVVEVEFADGTKWRLPNESLRRPLDESLASANAAKCPDAAKTSEMISLIHQVRFNSSVHVVTPEDEGATSSTSIPQLLFSCVLHDSRAECPGQR